eukprot:1922803-Pleurochrysis_carterae.AAC.2
MEKEHKQQLLRRELGRLSGLACVAVQKAPRKPPRKQPSRQPREADERVLLGGGSRERRTSGVPRISSGAAAARSAASAPPSPCSTCIASSRCTLSPSATPSSPLLDAHSSERTSSPVPSRVRNSRPCRLVSPLDFMSNVPGRSEWRREANSADALITLLLEDKSTSLASLVVGSERRASSSSHVYVWYKVRTSSPWPMATSSSDRFASLRRSDATPPASASSTSCLGTPPTRRRLELATLRTAPPFSARVPEALPTELACPAGGTYRRGSSALQWMPRATRPPAPQSQKKRERRE